MWIPIHYPKEYREPVGPVPLQLQCNGSSRSDLFNSATIEGHKQSLKPQLQSANFNLDSLRPQCATWMLGCCFLGKRSCGCMSSQCLCPGRLTSLIDLSHASNFVGTGNAKHNLLCAPGPLWQLMGSLNRSSTSTQLMPPASSPVDVRHDRRRRAWPFVAQALNRSAPSAPGMYTTFKNITSLLLLLFLSFPLGGRAVSSSQNQQESAGLRSALAKAVS